MKVVQIDAAEHAVLGGHTAAKFKITNHSELFRLLSDTLYQDKKLAVVREVLCNAWDAHIVAGKEDTPVQVECTPNKLVIRDFGPGISDTEIVDIYCSLMGSTKIEQDNQTGGFGLGSKAPFAYTDFFTVISRYRGKQSIYALSRGSLESEGVPEIRLMSQSDTTDTGLEVHIPVGSIEDARVFESNVRRVAWQGGINATLNTERLDSIDYGKTKDGEYLWVKGTSHMEVLVKIGAVLYPLNRSIPEINVEHTRFKPIHDSFGGTLILRAHPGKVGVTPSRESLSYTVPTIAYLAKLIRRAANEINAILPKATGDYALELARRTDPVKALKTRSFPAAHFDDGNVAHTPYDIAFQAAKTKFQRYSRDSARYLARGWRHNMPLLGKLKFARGDDWDDLINEVDLAIRKTIVKAVLKSGVPGKISYYKGYAFTPIRKEVNFRIRINQVYLAERQFDITQRGGQFVFHRGACYYGPQADRRAGEEDRGRPKEARRER